MTSSKTKENMDCSSGDSRIYESYEKLINPAYPTFLKRLGIEHAAASAEGATITDSAGKIYIDCVGGYGLYNLGHNHPDIIRVLIDQINQKQLFTKPLISEVPVMLAEYLSQVTPGDLSCSFICNSGSEAIDSAMKMARLYRGKKRIITAQNSFHGFTFGALSASGIPSFKRLFEPLVPGIVHVPFGDIEALQATISSETAAVMLEPIQHEAGIFIPPRGYFEEVRQLCDDNQALLILDEIKTGLGKTGRMFACEHFHVVPDILVLGKSLGGGMMPIGALVARKHLWKKFGLSFPMSASSFAGNVLACRAGLTALEIIQQNSLIPDCGKKGDFVIGELKRLVSRYPGILKSVDGMGLIIGLEASGPKKVLELSQEMTRQGVLSVPAFGNPSVLMIEPPLVISHDQLTRVIQSIESACEKISKGNGE